MPDDIKAAEATDTAKSAPHAEAVEGSAKGQELVAAPHRAVAKPELVAGSAVVAIVPRTIEEVARVAKAVIVAGLAPDSYKQGAPEEVISKVMVGIMKGAEVGFPPITALSTIAIINGRPTIWGDGAVALAQAAGIVDKVEQLYEGTPGEAADPSPNDFRDDYAAIYRIWRKGQEQPYEGRFSVRDAKRAHLWANARRDPWIKYPKRMLMARARAFALRDGFADALSGLSIREEIEDMPAEAPRKTDTSFLDDAPRLTAPEPVLMVAADVETVAAK